MAWPGRHPIRIAGVLSVAVGVACGSALAGSAPPSRQQGESEVYESVRLRYTAHEPGTRSGLMYAVRQRAVPAGTQPPPVRSVAFRFHAGTRFDTRATRECTAADDELAQRGPRACAAGSVLGIGRATIFIGTAEDVVLRATAINVRNGLRVVLQTESGTVLRVLQARIRGAVVRLRLPRVPLAGGREAALTSFRLNIGASGTGRRPYLRTPRTCPRDGHWRIVYDVAYEPPGRQRPYDLTRCRHRPDHEVPDDIRTAVRDTTGTVHLRLRRGPRSGVQGVRPGGDAFTASVASHPARAVR